MARFLRTKTQRNDEQRNHDCPQDILLFAERREGTPDKKNQVEHQLPLRNPHNPTPLSHLSLYG
jgi:hypothetical protein